MNFQDLKKIQGRGSRRKAHNPFARLRTRRRAMLRIYESTTGREYLQKLAEKFSGTAEEFRDYVFGPEKR